VKKRSFYWGLMGFLIIAVLGVIIDVARAQSPTATAVVCFDRTMIPPPVISTPWAGDYGGICSSSGELCMFTNSIMTCFDWLVANGPLSGGNYRERSAFPCWICTRACRAVYGNCIYLPVILKTYERKAP